MSGDSGRRRTPLVVAHRGASAVRAEHTLQAYELALEHGADALECDVRLTRDGHLVCVHDRRVDRTSTGRGVVSQMTLEGLAALDFTSWHDPVPESADELVGEGSHRADLLDLDAGERGEADAQTEETDTVPSMLTLAQLLELVTDYARPARLFIETKHPVRYGGLVEAKLLAELRRYGLASPPSAAHARAVVMSFSPSAVWRVRRSAPMLPTVLLGRTAAALAPLTVAAVGATAVGPGINLLRADPGLVLRAAEQGRATYTWTVDSAEEAAFCQELGVGWIATNHPQAMRGWLT
ncbi:glycerophosphodiester phosphodiesterase family protein [Rhodococcus sp. X156]|uniref:glycerophosphodiester phosphodiesterase family protein n=1 Tax=Rhodococcus sp. X156 TaxID=2499145 RepID=UPI001F4A088D|nr:glycerophosphodiester phosphodiesterase family protein [Rhodococcus sp. X156]